MTENWTNTKGNFALIIVGVVPRYVRYQEGAREWLKLGGHSLPSCIYLPILTQLCLFQYLPWLPLTTAEVFLEGNLCYKAVPSGRSLECSLARPPRPSRMVSACPVSFSAHLMTSSATVILFHFRFLYMDLQTQPSSCISESWDVLTPLPVTSFLSVLRATIQSSKSFQWSLSSVKLVYCKGLSPLLSLKPFYDREPRAAASLTISSKRRSLWALNF